jgi:four helix bundle protein
MVSEGVRDLLVWRKAIELVVASYSLSTRLPSSERYGLRAQVQRAAVSVAANLAEGNARMHRKEYVHHLSIAQGSLKELETYLVLVQRLGWATQNDLAEIAGLCGHVSRMVRALSRSLRATVDPVQRA